MMVRKPDEDVHGYVYSHETRCRGRIVAVLPYRDTPGGREYLVKSEMTPCWGFDRVRSAVTGGWEGGDIADDAVHEMLEETGYAITCGELIPLGESWASKSSDTVYTLFSVDLTGREAGEALGDGIEQPNIAEWITAAELTAVMDPQVHVMFRRLATRPAAPQADGPPLPEGEYARVEIMGHDYHTGWVTERDRAGVRVLAIADWDGRVLAEVPGQSLYKFVPLPTPLKRPDERAAIEAAGGSDDYLWDTEEV
jgi:8-oxo-dGTP pyrophosphatase MutT (NUDIX family)